MSLLPASPLSFLQITLGRLLARCERSEVRRTRSLRMGARRQAWRRRCSG